MPAQRHRPPDCDAKHGFFGALSVAYLAQSVFALGQSLSFATGRSARVPRIGMLQLVLALVLAWLAPAGYGALGIAGAFAIAGIIGMLCMTLATARQLKLTPSGFFQAALPGIGSGLCAVALVQASFWAGWKMNGLLSLTCIGIAGLCSAALAALLIAKRLGR